LSAKTVAQKPGESVTPPLSPAQAFDCVPPGSDWAEAGGVAASSVAMAKVAMAKKDAVESSAMRLRRLV
jgi:hypothetical protein